MSTYTDQPFSEIEERYILAEILKKSNISPTTLMNLIQDEQIDPAWNELALPNGRSVSSCQYALGNLNTRIQQQLPFQRAPSQPLAPDAQRRSGKRPYSLGDATTSVTRELQPRPMYSPYNGPQPAHSPVTMSPVEPPRKKRGRPTKAEREKRLVEASAKGEVWPKPRNKTKIRRVSEPITAETSMGHGAGSMDESAGETSGTAMARSTREESGSAPTATMNSPRSIQNLPMLNPPTTPRATLQDIIQPAGQVSHDEMRAERSSGPDSGAPFFAQQQAPQSQQSPLLSHQPRLPATTHMQSFSPSMAPYHSTSYPSQSPRR